jgi:hypothetical protein
LFGKAGERQWKAVYRAGRAPSPGVRIGRRTTYDPGSDFSTEGVGLFGKEGGTAVEDSLPCRCPFSLVR